MASGTEKMNNWTLLWTNPNPSTLAAFASQTISIPNLSDFSELRIELVDGVQDYYYQIDNTLNERYIITLVVTSSVGYIRRRPFQVGATSITFNDCLQASVTASYITENRYCQPYRIYGR